MEKTTVRFYTDNGKYMGWQYIYKTTYKEVRNWLRSGNYCMVGLNKYNSFTSISKLLRTFTR